MITSFLNVCAMKENKVKCLNPWDPQSKRQYMIDGVYRTLDAGQCQGGQAHGICYKVSMNMISLDGYNIDSNTEVFKTITAGRNDTHNLPVICYCIEGNTVDRTSRKNGRGWCENVSPTLNTQDRHAIVYDGSSVTSPGNWNNPKFGDPCYALHTDSRNYVVIALEGNGARPSHMGNGYSNSGTMYTLNTIETHSVCYEDTE